MPGGKTATRGAVGWHNSLIDHLDLSALTGGRRRDRARPPSKKELTKLTSTLRHAVAFYDLAMRGPPALTSTERRRELKGIKAAARGLRHEPLSVNNCERLLEALKCNLHTRDILHRYLRGTLDGALRPDPLDLVAFERGIDDAIARGAELDEREMRAVELVAEIDIRKLSARTRWPDPALPRLVSDLVPIWRRVTGRTPAPSSTREGGKTSPFSEWVRSVLKAVELKSPSANSISRAVRIVDAAPAKTPIKLRQKRTPKNRA